jgi:transcriptional regulator with XRE-family HTH domain
MDRSEFNAHVGHRIRRVRRRRDLTQAELGEHCDVSYQSIQKYEAGRIAISAHTLWRLAQALAVNVADILPANDVESVPDPLDRDLSR